MDAGEALRQFDAKVQAVGNSILEERLAPVREARLSGDCQACGHPNFKHYADFGPLRLPEERECRADGYGCGCDRTVAERRAAVTASWSDAYAQLASR